MQLEAILSKNAGLRNAHAGRRCFIIGNGPSIATQDLTLLRDETCIVVNSFHRHPEAGTIKPGYWIVADPDFWGMQDKHLFPALQQVQNLCIPTRLFVPSGGFSCLSQVNTGPIIDPHFFHYAQDAGINAPVDFTTGLPPYGQNVVIVALMLAYFLGCNPIYFLGCDHDFMNITREEYEKSAIKHFYPDAKAANPSEIISWSVWQSSMAAMDHQYAQLKTYASLWGFEVFNATRGGCLEHFPRVTFETLFTENRALRHPVPPLATTDLYRLTDVAVKLIETEEYQPALTILDELLRHNINRNDKVQGLDYLKAISLAKLSRYPQALLFARQDFTCNVDNRGNSGPLIEQLETRLNLKTAVL